MASLKPFSKSAVIWYRKFIFSCFSLSVNVVTLYAMHFLWSMKHKLARMQELLIHNVDTCIKYAPNS